MDTTFGPLCNAFRRADELQIRYGVRACCQRRHNRYTRKKTHMTKVDLGASIAFVLVAARFIMAVEFLIEI